MTQSTSRTLPVLFPGGRASKPKRNKMEIYNDILSVVREELTYGEAKPTRVQALSNLAYDKLVRYLDELEDRKMLVQNPLGITEKGLDFLRDYGRIRSFVLEIRAKYLDVQTFKV